MASTAITTTQQEQPGLRRMTIKEPVWTQSSTSQQLQEALQYRIKNDFKKASELLEAVKVAEQGDSADGKLSFRSVWLQCQILKTMQQRGHFKAVLEQAEQLMRDLDDKYDILKGTMNTPRENDSAGDKDDIEYLYFHLMYKKAKVLRKTRQMQRADETCQFLIDHVRDQQQTESEPTIAAPAVGAGATVEEIKDDDVAKPAAKEPKAYWKFAVKAAHLKVTMLALCMEFAKSKRLMFDFAEPVLVTLLKKFTPELFNSEESKNDGIPVSLSAKVLPDQYYSFQHRRVYAKLRRAGYFCGESEKLYRQLLHDELRLYKLYDFEIFEEENPVVVEIKDDSVQAASGQEQSDLIEETKTEEQEAKPSADAKKAAIDAEKKAAEEIITKFGVDYSQIKTDNVEEFVAEKRDLQNFGSLPINQVIKTISGLCKVLINRLSLAKAEEGLNFIIEAVKKVAGVESGELLSVVKYQHELASMFLVMHDGPRGKNQGADTEDCAGKITTEARNTVEQIIGEEDQFNYLRAKALSQVGKTELMKKNQEKSEKLFLEAQTQVSCAFGSDQPLVAKYNQFLVETYNLKPESPQRTVQISEICKRNVEIAQKNFGEKNLYCVRVLYTLYTACLHEPTQENSDNTLKMLAEMVHDGQEVKANHFLYKGILVNTLLAMQQRQMSEQMAQRIQMTLNGVFQSMIAYVEGDRNHAFLEEVVSLLATFFESMRDYRNALYMWHHFLGIQERLYGEDKIEMISTFKKIAGLHSQVGNPLSANKFFDKAQILMDKQKEQSSANLTEEQKKDDLEDQASLYFQQYITAQQTGDLARAVELLTKQTECQVELHGEQSTHVCSNLFLMTSNQMKLGRYTDAKANSKRIIEMAEPLKDDFKHDFAIVASKFYLQKANLDFIFGEFEEAKQTAAKGLELVSQVENTDDASVAEATAGTQRDLLNLTVRARAKLENADPCKLREEIAKERSMPITFMTQHDEEMSKLEQVHDTLKTHQKTKKAEEGQDVAEDDDEDDDEGESSQMNKAAMIFGMASMGVSALTYAIMNKA